MTVYWLVIMFCVEGAECENRLVDFPWPDLFDCRTAALALVRSDTGYLPTFTCTSVRPDGVPLAPAFVGPERWA